MLPVSRVIPLTLLVGGVIVLAGCTGGPPTAENGYLPSKVGGRQPTVARGHSAADLDIDSYWDGAGVVGEPRIEIDLSEQMAYFYKGNQKVGVSRVASGKRGMHDTPIGEFKIIQKSRDHESNLYGDYVYPDGTIAKKDVGVRQDKQPPGTEFDGADMPYFMRFHNGVGLHAGYLPGFRLTASHGCVRMPERMAGIYFENVEIGTPVIVRR